MFQKQLRHHVHGQARTLAYLRLFDKVLARTRGQGERGLYADDGPGALNTVQGIRNCVRSCDDITERAKKIGFSRIRDRVYNGVAINTYDTVAMPIEDRALVCALEVVRQIGDWHDRRRILQGIRDPTHNLIKSICQQLSIQPRAFLSSSLYDRLFVDACHKANDAISSTVPTMSYVLISSRIRDFGHPAPHIRRMINTDAVQPALREKLPRSLDCVRDCVKSQFTPPALSAVRSPFIVGTRHEAVRAVQRIRADAVYNTVLFSIMPVVRARVVDVVGHPVYRQLIDTAWPTFRPR